MWEHPQQKIKEPRQPSIYFRIFRAFHYITILPFVAKILGTLDMTDLSYSKYCCIHSPCTGSPFSQWIKEKQESLETLYI